MEEGGMYIRTEEKKAPRRLTGQLLEKEVFTDLSHALDEREIIFGARGRTKGSSISFRLHRRT